MQHENKFQCKVVLRECAKSHHSNGLGELLCELIEARYKERVNKIRMVADAFLPCTLAREKKKRQVEVLLR